MLLFMLWSGILKITWGGLIVSGSSIYTNTHFHIFVYMLGYMFVKRNDNHVLNYIVPMSGSLGSPPLDPDVLILLCLVL